MGLNCIAVDAIFACLTGIKVVRDHAKRTCAGARSGCTAVGTDFGPGLQSLTGIIARE